MKLTAVPEISLLSIVVIRLLFVATGVNGFIIENPYLPSNLIQLRHDNQPRGYSSRILTHNEAASVRLRGRIPTFQRIPSKLNIANEAFASIMAGSLAGAIGVGVAFPLDTLKTKAQVMSSQNINTGYDSVASISTGENVVSANETSEPIGMLQLIPLIYNVEGIAGFYGGVKGMMIGQAFIKSVAFCVNDTALSLLPTIFPTLTTTSSLLLAACLSGFITSFLVNPIERIKVMMQADSKGDDGDETQYGNEINCIKLVVKNDGWQGLLGRGLGPTLAREVPSYGIYFFLYGVLSRLPISESIGSFAPLVNGALSGMASWVPVYPVDVVKTLVQNTDGITESVSSIEVAKELYADGGIGAFFDGLTPKMLRAAINHAVTFFVYDMIMNGLTG